MLRLDRLIEPNRLLDCFPALKELDDTCSRHVTHASDGHHYCHMKLVPDGADGFLHFVNVLSLASYGFVVGLDGITVIIATNPVMSKYCDALAKFNDSLSLHCIVVSASSDIICLCNECYQKCGYDHVVDVSPCSDDVLLSKENLIDDLLNEVITSVLFSSSLDLPSRSEHEDDLIDIFRWELLRRLSPNLPDYWKEKISGFRTTVLVADDIESCSSDDGGETVDEDSKLEEGEVESSDNSVTVQRRLIGKPAPAVVGSPSDEVDVVSPVSDALSGIEGPSSDVDQTDVVALRQRRRSSSSSRQSDCGSRKSSSSSSSTSSGSSSSSSSSSNSSSSSDSSRRSQGSDSDRRSTKSSATSRSRSSTSSSRSDTSTQSTRTSRRRTRSVGGDAGRQPSLDRSSSARKDRWRQTTPPVVIDERRHSRRRRARERRRTAGGEQTPRRVLDTRWQPYLLRAGSSRRQRPGSHAIDDVAGGHGFIERICALYKERKMDHLVMDLTRRRFNADRKLVGPDEIDRFRGYVFRRCSNDERAEVMSSIRNVCRDRVADEWDDVPFSADSVPNFRQKARLAEVFDRELRHRSSEQVYWFH